MIINAVKLSIVTIFLLTLQSGSAQVPNSYFLPDIEYDATVEDPQSFLNYQIGEWHITHDQLYRYMKNLCESSPNCIFEEIARTHENRPLVNLIISSKENLANLADIKATRSAMIEPGNTKKIEINSVPLVLYQGYSIHGNESSGSNASTLVAYYLLAGKSDELTKLLDEAIIIIDPSYNPDGLNRFSTWANMHKHQTLSSDPNGREFNEVWPGGRTNHYWFDLNRDWIFNIHPESKGRIRRFQEWQPDILTDHHEMGSNSTFFFQPGVPSRTNPNTPKVNQELTEKIAGFHATSLDSIGSLYFTKKRFDDYYYGKGSTYPDINGCVGILFEQASSRGHLRETDNGTMSFPFTIRNQVVTSLSTQRAAIHLKDQLLDYKKDFFQNSSHRKGAYTFQTDDHYKASFFIDMLNRHKIDVYKMSGANKENQYVVPKNQRQSGLIKTIFEKVNAFPDSLFYDVSAWTLPLALNIDSKETTAQLQLGDKVGEVVFDHKKQAINDESYALYLDWKNYNTPAVLYQLLEKNIAVRVTQKPIEVSTFDNRSTDKKSKINKTIESGTLIIQLHNQKQSKKEIIAVVSELCQKYEIPCYSIASGYSDSGDAIGSPDQKRITQPKVAMIVGEGVSSYEAGSAWYQLDQRLHIPFTMIDKRQLSSRDLDRYNIIIMPDGRYNQEDLPTEKLRKWLDNGGTLVAYRRAINFTNKIGWTKLERVKADARSKARVVYENMAQSSGSQVIGGAIFNTYLELAHPLFYGYTEAELPVFKKGTQFYGDTENALASPMHYTEKPVLSGYTSKRNRTLAAKAVGLHCAGVGGGKVIAIVDNPNFRGYWLGGSKLFANTLFFSDLIAKGALQR